MRVTSPDFQRSAALRVSSRHKAHLVRILALFVASVASSTLASSRVRVDRLFSVELCRARDALPAVVRREDAAKDARELGAHVVIHMPEERDAA